jgi:hypothetical protein
MSDTTVPWHDDCVQEIAAAVCLSTGAGCALVKPEWQSVQVLDGVTPDAWHAMQPGGVGWFVVGVAWIVARLVLWQPAALQLEAATVWVASAAVGVGCGVGVLSGDGSWRGFVGLTWHVAQSAVVATPPAAAWHARQPGPPALPWIVSTTVWWH